ncbi:MAG: hypothetical protein IT442_00600, partial [Phycisphaeraceae bacterium]|nr:hypothetical protein [Phycisphaeraceae bacterium]
MEKGNEILEALRRIESAQKAHHEEWQAVVNRAQEQQRSAIVSVTKMKRRTAIWIALLVGVALLLTLYPQLLGWWAARSLCPAPQGVVDTSRFDGRYSFDQAATLAAGTSSSPGDPTTQATAQDLSEWAAEQFADFTVDNGVIRSGRGLVQEFRLVQTQSMGDVLVGTAVWHEDIHDPGDSSHVSVTLKLT